MTLFQVTLFATMISTVTQGFSFSEFSTGLTVDEENRIYGGSNVTINKSTYVAGLHSNCTNSSLFCGGTLITPEFILTAGHCLNDEPLLDVYASLGSIHQMGGGSSTAEMIRVIEAFRHPSYYLSSDLQTLIHDVALLKLERPSKIQPPRLAAANGSDNKPGTIATALGWGLINNETFSDTLQTVDIEIITDAECIKRYVAVYEDTANNSIVDEWTMCAGTGNGKDSCSGDSGGPLLVNDVLVGIVSTGPKDCGILPAKYTRVSRYLSFINDVIDGGSTGNITKILTAGMSSWPQVDSVVSQDGSSGD
ncbi:hypothetical protein PHMEG_00011942 [Phytophthora megakarya]|uniref:Peptidase S1 domain-containing protein n=1 Tax=Phytophthora megakarya TaxID=4795 RepID=A0A225WCJ8_9STRA|nr:hypothetical protein PHMEG_00011942 [Phytophthora megakarya]